jgi:hypothetical protein
LETTDAKMMMTVTSWGGAQRMAPRMIAVRSPDRSATPTPRSATRTVPRGAKPEKLVTTLSKSQRMPSGARRELVVMMTPSFPGRGSSTETPSALVMALMMMIARQKRAKSVTGWGRRLPSHSTTERRRATKFALVFGSLAGSVGVSGMWKGYRIVGEEAGLLRFGFGVGARVGDQLFSCPQP